MFEDFEFEDPHYRWTPRGFTWGSPTRKALERITEILGKYDLRPGFTLRTPHHPSPP